MLEMLKNWYSRRLSDPQAMRLPVSYTHLTLPTILQV